MGANYLPVSDWSGYLILPESSKRRDDGGVILEIKTAPKKYASLINKKVWLCRDSRAITYYYYDQMKTDIYFDSETQKSIDEENNHPERLNGWHAVSFLESLAGSRKNDDMLVIINEPEIVKDSVYASCLNIGREPIQVSGYEYSLVQFVKPASKNKDKYIIRHYNKKKGDFSGEEEKVSINESRIFPRSKVKQGFIDDIEKTDLNRGGWYIYTVHNAKKDRVITAIEPRALLTVDYNNEIHGRSKALKYFSDAVWKNRPQGIINKTNIRNLEKNNPEWAEGDRGVVLHIFGWKGGPMGDPFKEGQRVTGHFALGFVKVIRDDFTGELKFDITYKQAYAHNRESVIAGSFKRHHFMGNIERGWAFTVPVTDTLVRIPLLTKDLSGESVSCLMDVLDFFLEKITIKMRSGNGNGIAPVNAAINCSQETAMALYDAAEHILNVKRKHQFIYNDIEKDHHLKEMRKCVNFARKLKSFYVPFFIPSRRWNKYTNNKKISIKDYTGINMFVGAILSWRTIIPIVHYKGLLRTILPFADCVTVLQSYQIGGINKEIHPVMPTNNYRKARIESELDFDTMAQE